MPNLLYDELCDDAQAYIGMAIAKIARAATIISDQPGTERLAASDARDIADGLGELRRKIDSLPVLPAERKK